MHGNSDSNFRKHPTHYDNRPSFTGFARAYVPFQPFVGLFPLDLALKKGTVFPNINVDYPRY
jgi:hypothetical protein